MPLELASSPSQVKDLLNSTTRNSTHGATQYVGTFSLTRPINVIRGTTVVASNVLSGLGGTFVFEYSDDGVSHNGISETRTILSFATVRDFDLKNFGDYFRIKFTPSRALVSSEEVAITTQFDKQYSGPFVRLADQETEQDNMAAGNMFAYNKAYDPFTRLSVNLRPQSVSLIPSPIPAAPLGAAGVYLSDVIDCLGFSSLRWLIAASQVSLSAGVRFEWSDTPTFVVQRDFDPFTYDSADLVKGSATFPTVTKTRYLRLRYTNGAIAQTSPMFIGLQLNSFPFLDEVRTIPLNTGRTGQQDVTISAVALALSSLPRRALRLKNLTGSARPGFYGFNLAGLTTGNTDELAVGESVEFDLDETQSVYVITTSTSGAGVRFSWSELN